MTDFPVAAIYAANAPAATAAIEQGRFNAVVADNPDPFLRTVRLATKDAEDTANLRAWLKGRGIVFFGERD